MTENKNLVLEQKLLSLSEGTRVEVLEEEYTVQSTNKINDPDRRVEHTLNPEDSELMCGATLYHSHGWVVAEYYNVPVSHIELLCDDESKSIEDLEQGDILKVHELDIEAEMTCPARSGKISTYLECIVKDNEQSFGTHISVHAESRYKDTLPMKKFMPDNPEHRCCVLTSQHIERESLADQISLNP